MRCAFLLAPLVLALSACGSSPKTQFYTLDAVPPASPAPTPAARAQIEVGKVEIPGTIDRLSMVTRKSNDQLDISDQNRWAAPLDDLTRRALTQDLRQRLPEGTVLAPGDSTPPGTRVVTLNVQQFMADASGRVVLDADWAIGTVGKAATSRHAHIEETAGGADGGIVATGMSRALGKLADEISASAASG
jgi:uncharacterized protein